jgi:hypothetical protein
MATDIEERTVRPMPTTVAPIIMAAGITIGGITTGEVFSAKQNSGTARNPRCGGGFHSGDIPGCLQRLCEKLDWKHSHLLGGKKPVADQSFSFIASPTSTVKFKFRPMISAVSIAFRAPLEMVCVVP